MSDSQLSEITLKQLVRRLFDVAFAKLRSVLYRWVVTIENIDFVPKSRLKLVDQSLIIPSEWLAVERRLSVFCMTNSTMVGRDDLLTSISNRLSFACELKKLSRKPAYFLFASPGVGKSRLLQALYTDNYKPGHDNSTPMYCALDFNNGFGNFEGVSTLLSDSRYYSLVETLPLIRAFHCELIDESIPYNDFLIQVVDLVEDQCASFPIVTMVEVLKVVKSLRLAMWAAFRHRCDSLGYKHIVFLVDEIVKGDESVRSKIPVGPGATSWAEVWRSFICKWADPVFNAKAEVGAVLFTTLDDLLMEKEVSVSRRQMVPFSLPLLSVEQSIALLDVELRDSIVQFSIIDRRTALKLIAVYTCGHCRSLWGLIERIMELAKYQQVVLWSALRSMIDIGESSLTFLFPDKELRPEIFRQMLRQLLRPTSKEGLSVIEIQVRRDQDEITMWQLVQRGALNGTYSGNPVVPLFMILALAKGLESFKHYNFVTKAVQLLLHPHPDAVGFEAMVSAFEILMHFAFPEMSLLEIYAVNELDGAYRGPGELLQKKLMCCTESAVYNHMEGPMRYNTEVLYSSDSPSEAGWNLVSFNRVIPEDKKSPKKGTKRLRVEQIKVVAVTRQVKVSELEVDKAGKQKLATISVADAQHYCQALVNDAVPAVSLLVKSASLSVPLVFIFIALNRGEVPQLTPQENQILIVDDEQLIKVFGVTLIQLMRMLVRVAVPYVGNTALALLDDDQ